MDEEQMVSLIVCAAHSVCPTSCSLFPLDHTLNAEAPLFHTALRHTHYVALLSGTL